VGAIVSEFDQHRDTYEHDIDRAIRFSGKGHDYFTQVKAEYLVEILKGLAPRDRHLRLLDVGCGHGLIHRALQSADLPLKISGIDVAASVIEIARRENPSVDYNSYDGAVLPYGQDEFDSAVTITVMHHVPPEQWGDFLAEMKRVVRPGGVVAVFEHNPYNPLTAHIVRTCPIDANAVLLPSRQLKALMRKVGLQSVEGRFILFTPFNSPLFKLFDRLMGRIPLGAQYYVVGRVPGA
jgi:2-polyprenyl-3-methyl-5-hydroxy-6-metoxy-1,4-benzoquinol methylase